jgi:hypothetical protein
MVGNYVQSMVNKYGENGFTNGFKNGCEAMAVAV